MEGDEDLLVGGERDRAEIERARAERRKKTRILAEVCALFALGFGLLALVVLCSGRVMVRGRHPAAGVKVYPPTNRASMGH